MTNNKKAKKEKEEKLAESRNSSGWMKGKVSGLAASEGFTEITISIIETNYAGLNAGDTITVGGDEWDPCKDNFGPLLMGYSENGASFEAIIDKHTCGSKNYRIVQFLN